MEDSLTKEIDSSTDENLIVTRNLVDKYIMAFNMTSDQDERNDMIMKVIGLVQKKYIAPQYERFEANRDSIIAQIAKSYVISVKVGKPNIH
jgi:hypothetical protein